MDVAIAGGHGKIARRPTRLLAAHGDRVRSIIRNPAHADDVRADGAEPVVCELEHRRTLYVNTGDDPVEAALAKAPA